MGLNLLSQTILKNTSGKFYRGDLANMAIGRFNRLSSAANNANKKVWVRRVVMCGDDEIRGLCTVSDWFSLLFYFNLDVILSDGLVVRELLQVVAKKA